MSGHNITSLRRIVLAVASLVLFFTAPHLCAKTLSAYAPKDELGPKWNDLGWIDDTAFPWVYSYTYNNWFYLYDGVNADADVNGYWFFYFTPDNKAYGWGYVLPGAGWWCYTLDSTVYWLRFGQSLPADGKVLRVSIMIDDGPTENTARLLDILAQKGVKANFDLVGANCEARPDDTLAIWNAGHTINNHSYRHEWPSKVSDAELVNEVVKCNEAVETITGVAPVWYWTPYGDYDLRLNRILPDANLRACFGNTIVSSEDYLDTTSAAAIKANIVNNVKDGSLLLFHEWRDDSIEQMPSIIDELRAKGCVFLPYTDMDAYLRSKR
jgi:peptidoglycan/xylan/chitin deacetylase (PgdA/CDA1 family)